MRVREITALAIALMPFITQANETTVDGQVDTFGRLLSKQLLVLESDLDAKIRSNQSQGKISALPGPIVATPLPEAKQDISSQEPIVEAIWGMAGKEVAEVAYKGQRVAISMQEPYISRLDGWKLENISNFEIILIKTDGRKVINRKSINLNWGIGNSTRDSAVSPALPNPGFSANPNSPFSLAR